MLLAGSASAMAAGLAAGLVLQLPGDLAHPPAKAPLTERRALDPGLARYIKTLAALGPAPAPRPRPAPAHTVRTDPAPEVEPAYDESAELAEAAPPPGWRSRWREARAYPPDVYIVVEDPPAYVEPPPPWRDGPPRPAYARRDEAPRGYWREAPEPVPPPPPAPSPYWR
jgi:hypothetical protein